MRRFLLTSLALLASSALSAPAAQAAAADVDNPIRTECNRIYHCTVYGPNDEVIISVDQLQDEPIETECNRIFHCTVYGPDDQPIVSVDGILELIDRLPPTGA